MTIIVKRTIKAYGLDLLQSQSYTLTPDQEAALILQGDAYDASTSAPVPIVGVQSDPAGNMTAGGAKVGLSAPEVLGVRGELVKISNSIARPPAHTDNTSKGFSTSSLWQYNGKVYDAPIMTSTYGGWRETTTPRRAANAADIIGCSSTWASSNTLFAGGLDQVVSGYTGYACTISVTINSVATSYNISILSNGQLDVATLEAAIAKADAGTYVTVTTLYDQSGLGNHFTKNSSFSAPYIVWDEVMRRYVLNTAYGVSASLDAPTGVAGTSGFAVATNSLSVIAVGRAIGCNDNDGYVLCAIGDYAANSREIVLQGHRGTYIAWSTEQGTRDYNVSADSRPCVMIYSSGTTTSELHVNDTSFTNSVAPSSQVQIGGRLFKDHVAHRTGQFRLVSFVVAKTAVTAAQILSIKKAAYCKYDIRPQSVARIVTLGDSRIASMPPLSTSGPATSIALELDKKLSGDYRVINMGDGGKSNATLVSVGDMSYAVSTYDSTVTNWVVYLCSVNDFIADSASVATCIANLKTNMATLKAAGYKIILVNELATTKTTGSASTNLPLVRAAITAAGTTGMGVDYIIDPLQFSPLADATNTTIYPDGLHPNVLVGGVIADMAASIISTAT